MRKHVWRVFALVGQAKAKARVIVGLQVQVQVVKYGAGWYQRISRVRAVADADVKSRRRWQSWAKVLFAMYRAGLYKKHGRCE